MTKMGVLTEYVSPQKLFFILITLLFVVAPFYYQPNFGGEGLFLPYNSSVWVVAVWVIAASALLISFSRSIILPKYWLGLACLPVGALISGFIVEAVNPTEWLVRISVITGGFIFLIGLFQFRLNSRQIEQSLYLMLAMGMISSSYGLYQILSKEHFFEFIPLSPLNQPLGIFQQRNLQASLMATLLVLVYLLMSRPYLRSLSLFMRPVLCITAFSASYNIAAAGSRVGLLGALLGILLICIGRWKFFKFNKKTFLSALIFTLLGALLQTSGLITTSAKLDRAMGGIESDVRWKVYYISWNTFAESPVTGHGLGSFSKAFQDKRGEFQSQGILHLENLPRFSHPHNEILFWLVEGGIISLAGILAATIATFIQLIKLGWQRGCGYAALLIPIVLHTQVELPFYISNTHWLLLLFLLFVTHQHGKRNVSTKNLSVSARSLVSISFVVLAVACSWLLIHSQIANRDLVRYFASGQKNPALLEAPLSSFYFRDYAKYLSLRGKLSKAVQNKDIQTIYDFINYTEALLSRTPAQDYYAGLISAYHVIGQHDRRDQLIKEATSIYEQDPLLERVTQQLRIGSGAASPP